MRGRCLAGVFLGVALVLGSALPAAADGITALGDDPAVLCQLTDPRLSELSGLVVSGDTMLAINDGGDRIEIFVLDSSCAVTEVHTAPVDPYDPEDMALAADGTVWLADTGDNNVQRETVALLAVRPDGSVGTYRLTYPDGPHDAEALLLAPDGTPYLVTKAVLGASGVYRPVGDLVDGGTAAMGKVATVAMTFTGTPGGPVGQVGQVLVTGGAVAADGAHLALRTYTDAYVWPLVDSDVAGAFATAPTRIPLPEAPQGEAIAFGADSRSLVVAGEGVPSDIVVLPLTAPEAAAAPVEEADGAPRASFADFTSSGLSPLTSAAIAVCVATVVVWMSGKFRRRS